MKLLGVVEGCEKGSNYYLLTCGLVEFHPTL
jgi:hypothetical protein